MDIREEIEAHIRACLKASEKDISDSLSKSLIVLLDGLGVVKKVDRELPGCGCEICDADNGVTRTLVEPLWDYEKREAEAHSNIV